MDKENLDQHFMIDKKLITRIVDYAELSDKDTVLEIGPGKGILTEELINKCKIIAVELDIDLFHLLQEKYEKNFKIQVVQGNALNKMNFLGYNKIVSNIPYSISEPLMIKILINQPEMVVLTTSKKFVDYLDKYRLLKTVYNYEIKEIVSKESFYPMPRVESVVIKFELKNDYESKFIREILIQYDKKLKNALISILEKDFTKNEIRKKIADMKSKDKSILNISNEDLDNLLKIFKK